MKKIISAKELSKLTGLSIQKIYRYYHHQSLGLEAIRRGGRGSIFFKWEPDKFAEANLQKSKNRELIVKSLEKLEKVEADLKFLLRRDIEAEKKIIKIAK